MRLSGIDIVRLDRQRMRKEATNLIALDAQARRELGDTFSHVNWDAESFLADRDGKWELSHAAISGSALLGFWISSRLSEDAHTHRVAVAVSVRERGVGRAMFDAVREVAATMGCRRLTLTVASDNHLAHRFYERLGFQRLRGDELAGFAAERRRRCSAEADALIEQSGLVAHRYAAYVAPING